MAENLGLRNLYTFIQNEEDENNQEDSLCRCFQNHAQSFFAIWSRPYRCKQLSSNEKDLLLFHDIEDVLEELYENDKITLEL